MKDAILIIATSIMISLLLLSFTATAKQDVKPANSLSYSNDWSPVTDESLAELRAGFVLNNGVIVDISFQKNIFRNGELVSYSYFQTPQDTNILTKDESNLTSFLPNSTLNTILQNTIDNQTLSTITNIDITVKNLEQAKQSFVQDNLYNAYFTGR